MSDTSDQNKPDENKLIAERRAKLARLREAGLGPETGSQDRP